MATSQYYFDTYLYEDGWRARFWGNYGRELIWWTQPYNYESTAKEAIEYMRVNAATAPLL
jgi:uncharacterized protein YegP (UPF0339 family)